MFEQSGIQPQWMGSGVIEIVFMFVRIAFGLCAPQGINAIMILPRIQTACLRKLIFAVGKQAQQLHRLTLNAIQVGTIFTRWRGEQFVRRNCWLWRPVVHELVNAFALAWAS